MRLNVFLKLRFGLESHCSANKKVIRSGWFCLTLRFWIGQSLLAGTGGKVLCVSAAWACYLKTDWETQAVLVLIIVVIKQITLTQSHNNQLSDFQSSMFIMIKLIFSAAEKLWSVDPNPWIENTCQPQIKLKAPWFTKVLLHASHINQLTVYPKS